MKKVDFKKILVGLAAMSIMSVMPTFTAFGQNPAEMPEATPTAEEGNFTEMPAQTDNPVLSLISGSTALPYSNLSSSSNDLIQNMRNNAPGLYSRYKSGRTISSVGMGLTIGGAALAIIGIAAADKETTTTGMQTNVNLSGPGAGIFIGGIICAAVGTPLWIVGGVKKKKAKRAYLNGYGETLTVPAAPSPYLKLTGNSQSIGFAFVF